MRLWVIDLKQVAAYAYNDDLAEVEVWLKGNPNSIIFVKQQADAFLEEMELSRGRAIDPFFVEIDETSRHMHKLPSFQYHRP